MDQMVHFLYVISEIKEVKMTKSEIYVEKTNKYLEELTKEMDFEIVDVEFVKEASQYYLRIYCDIDKEGGISIDDCVEISKKVSAWLDKEDFIPEEYILEVSSPGLGRALRKDKDFQRELGKEVELKLFKAINNQKEFRGILKSFDKEGIFIEIDNEDKKFARSEVAKINLALDF